MNWSKIEIQNPWVTSRGRRALSAKGWDKAGGACGSWGNVSMIRHKWGQISKGMHRGE